MQILIEDFVPSDRSVQWRIHDAYFEKRGIAAWKFGEIPYAATNNYAIGRQHARLLTKAIREMTRAGALAADEEIWLLEIGSGLGQFAGNFMRALDEGCGAFARQFAPRVRYIMSDYSATTVREAMRTPSLAPLVATGRIIPALFDLRQPRSLRDLRGAPIEKPLTALLSNYVCCVSPMKVLRKGFEGYSEKYVQVRAEINGDESAPEEVIAELFDRPTRPELMERLDIEVDWRPAQLEEVFPEGPHPDIIRQTLSPLEEATIIYPYVFLDLLGAIGPAMKRGGIVLINDYGSCEIAAFDGLQDGRPKHYGNTMNHGVNFLILDAWCRREGRSHVRTDNPFRAVHSTAIRFGGEISPAFASAFARLYVDRHDGEDLLDFVAAAREASTQEAYALAVRFYQRALQLDPDHLEALFRLGEACIDDDQAEQALAPLVRGKLLDSTGYFDFDFQTGRVFYRLERFDEALAAYERSLAREEDAATHTNIGRVHEDRKEWRKAYDAYCRALALNPKYERARRLVEALRTCWIDMPPVPSAIAGQRN